MQPDLSTPNFNDAADVEVADLLGDYNNALEAPHFSSTPEPRVLYSSEDEETDPTSSVTADYPAAYGRNNNSATSTFGKVIQPLKVRYTGLAIHDSPTKNASNSI